MGWDGGEWEGGEKINGWKITQKKAGKGGIMVKWQIKVVRLHLGAGG